MDAPVRDAFAESIEVVRAANARGIPLKLIGGQAVRLLCPLFPHRAREDQDMDFACVSPKKRDVIAFFGERGFQGDARFNTLHGDRQMYFTTADGKTSVDVVMDKLNMCHVLDFSDRIDRMPDTLDVHDLLHLLSGFEAIPGDDTGTIGLDRIGSIVSSDWGWWRTTTMNLDKLAQLAEGDHQDLLPEARRFEPAEQARQARTFCDEVPKTLKWKLRAKVG